MDAQTIAVDCFGMYRDDYSCVYDLLHMGVIYRLGRFPRRNRILAHKSTAAEEALVNEGRL